MSEATGCPGAVDIHVHAVPESLVGDVVRGRFPGVKLMHEASSVVLCFPGMAPSPPVPEPMRSAQRLGAIAPEHITTQLIGPWTDLFGYTLPDAEAAEWSRAYNEALVEEVAHRPHQVAMATVPLSYPARAVAELSAAHAMGCKGVMIGTDLPDLTLGSAELEPFWEAAATLEMPVLMHPTRLHTPVELDDAGLKNAVGRAGPTALSLAHLLYSGALLRHENLRVIACHGGGAFAAVAPRILRNHDLGWSGSDSDVSEAVGRLYFDSVVLDPELLGYLVARFGADRFLLGSDLPFPWEPDPVGTVLRAALEHTQRAAILGDNARRLYGLGPAQPCATCVTG